VPKSQLEDFLAQAAPLTARLDIAANSDVARLD